VTPMALMTDVFVLLERLQQSLLELRDELVEQPDVLHVELTNAQHHCRRIDAELRNIKSLLRGQVAVKANAAPDQGSDPPSPKGSPLKLIG
jgi:hypothetical protein